jgi:23S rRNA (pseudouridine1915-N3)-methyltransferase
MKLRVVALGHRMPAWVTAGWDDYAQRLPREFALELVVLKPEARDGGKPLARLLATKRRASSARARERS